MEEERCVDVVECAFDIGEENADFAAVLEFKDPCVDEKCGEVLCTVVFAESPLCVSVSVSGFEEGEERDGEQTFDFFG